MIKNDFYAGTSPTDIDLEWTSNLTNLAITDKTVDPFHAYYMGECPGLWVKRGTFTVSGSDDNTVYHMRTDTTYKNKWFFAAVETGVSGTGMQWNPNGTQWMGSYRLLNSFKPYYYNNIRHFDITLRMYDYSNTATLGNGEVIKYASAEYTNSNSIQLGVNEIWSLFNENGTFVATFNGTDYNIRMSMWDDTVHAFKLADNKYAFVSVIDNGATAWSPPRTGIYYNNYDIRFNVFNTVDCTGIENPAKWHLGKVFCSDAVNYAHYGWMLRSSSDMLRCPSGTNYNNATYDVHDGDEIVGWFYDCDVSKYVMDWCNAHSSAHVLTASGVAIKDDGGSDTLFDWGFDFPVWYTNIHGPITKTATSKDYQGNTVTPDRNSIYYENYDAVPVFTRKNVFQYREKPKSIVDLDFFKKLQPWQLYGADISDDEYDPEGGGTSDPGGDPDDGEEKDTAPDKQDWGDPMNPSNGFEIPYGLANYKAFSNAGIINFAERLWDAPDSFWEALTITNKNNANWLDYFISLRGYPYAINSTGEYANIYVGAGGQFYLGDEGTDLYASEPQHITFYILNFTIDKHYNNFLDFAPYTKAYIYLPFSGTWEVNPKYLYHTTLQILLKLDITDGSGVWQVIRSGADGAGSGYIILEKQCKIGVEIPLSGLTATTMSSNIVNATLGTYQRTGNEIGKIAGTVAAGTAIGGPVGAALGMAAGAVMTGLENSVDMANANREHISVNGGMSGLAAANANVIPSVTLVRPVAQNPDSFPHTIGHLVNKAATLSDLTGYTTCRNVDVSNVNQATEKEKAQLKKILESGFYA